MLRFLAFCHIPLLLWSFFSKRLFVPVDYYAKAKADRSPRTYLQRLAVLLSKLRKNRDRLEEILPR